jgi:DNA-binding XRE family transcriptional regulator
MTNERMREQRFRKRIPQWKLAVAMGVSTTKVWGIENGLMKPKPKEAQKLAKLLGASVQDLFPGVSQ